MTSGAGLYFELGLKHLTDLGAYDHMLFLLALVAPYRLKDWKKLIVLATAFTLGHSLTLALAALKIIPVQTQWIEFFIPVSILISALAALFIKPGGKPTFHYVLALVFGLIHGMGFSSFFAALLGKASNVVSPLLFFNLGIELGQILVILLIFGLYFLAHKLFSVQHRHWTLFVSGAATGLALVMSLENYPL